MGYHLIYLFLNMELFMIHYQIVFVDTIFQENYTMQSHCHYLKNKLFKYIDWYLLHGIMVEIFQLKKM